MDVHFQVADQALCDHIGIAQVIPGVDPDRRQGFIDLAHQMHLCDELEAHDLPPFESAFRQHAPAVMLSHLDLTDIAPGVPASMAPEVYDLLRDDLGFEGVAITDSLGMGAVGGRPTPALQALQAGEAAAAAQAVSTYGEHVA